MQYTPLSSIIRSTEMKLAAAVASLPIQNGTPLVFGLEDGVRVVSPSAGAAGEVLAGFAHQQVSAAPALPADAVKVEQVVVAAGGVITLDREPLAGQYVVTNLATGAPITVSAASGLTLTVAGGNAGVEVKVVYRHALTVREAVYRTGDVQPGGASGNHYGQIGVGQQGVIYTDRIDASVNWAAATIVTLDAAGMLTDQTGTGEAINAQIVAVPTSDYPYLGLQFNTI